MRSTCGPQRGESATASVPRLFITTTEMRAHSFLSMMCKELGRDALLLTCVCDLARGLKRCPTEARWHLSIDEGEQAVDLLAALREARRPYDEELAREAAERRQEEAKRELLRSDPEALRSHLRTWRQRNGSASHSDRPFGAALDIMLEREGALGEVERNALMALGAMLADPIQVRFAERDPTARSANLSMISSSTAGRFSANTLIALPRSSAMARRCDGRASASPQASCSMTTNWMPSPAKRRATARPGLSRSG